MISQFRARVAGVCLCLLSLSALSFASRVTSPYEHDAEQQTPASTSWEIRAEYRLKIGGTYLSEGGLQVSSIEPKGPGENLQNPNGGNGRLEPGDVILNINGVAVKSPADSQRALRLSERNQGRVLLHVRDVNTGRVFQWYTTAEIVNVPVMQGRLRAPTLTYQRFRERVREMIRAGKIPLEEPRFDWNAGDYLVCEIPSPVPSECMGETDRLQEYSMPLSRQISVEAIRHFRTKNNPRARAFWDQVLPQVELLIESMFIQIRDSKPGQEDQLSKSLFEVERRISQLYETELNRLARQNGKKGMNWIRYQCYASIATCRIVPANATCKYMAAGPWLLEQVINDRVPDWNYRGWLTAPNPGPLETANVTRVWVRWEDGRELTGTIHLPKSGGVLTLEPRGWHISQ